MDVEATRLPRRTEPINLLTGIFLKSIFPLAVDCSKTVIVGIFKNKGDTLGVLFNGLKGNRVYWSYDVFNQFAPHYNEITVAVENKRKAHFKIDTGREDIRVRNVFGKAHVLLYDGEYTLSLNSSNWTQLVNNLPLVYRSMRELFLVEDSVKNFVRDYLSISCETRGEGIIPETTLSPLIADRLTDELELYRRWPDGRSNGGESCS